MTQNNSKFSRRKFAAYSRNFLLGSIACNPVKQLLAQTSPGDRHIAINKMEVLVVGVSQRTNWIIVRLTASNGITGLGEASLGRRTELQELNDFFAMVEGQSPFDIQKYRERALGTAVSNNRPLATAFSSIEQALWDIVSKTLDTPLYNLFGGKLRNTLPVYANINRATSPRTPQGFAEAASQAVADGFNAIKAAPFDGFPDLSSESREITAARELGVESVFAIREAVGESVAVKIDAHSYFDVQLAIEVANELEPANLSWYEEPVAPTLLEETKIIHDRINQPLAGGEFLFGLEGFGPLCVNQAVDIIMPDVKHCGGLLEGLKISTLAESFDIKVSPHNPSGPISTGVSSVLCAVIPNFDSLEYQWGEADWRSDLVEPAEIFNNGNMAVSNLPGMGITLNEDVLAARRIAI